MKNKSKIWENYTQSQLWGMTILRVLIGWHFLYEGLIKVYTPGWTAKGYLQGAVGPFSHFFNALAASEPVIQLIDICNEWGLVLIGLSLFIGLFAKVGNLLGITLLIFYYLAYPPYAIYGINAHAEGSYWIVNKNLIEISALSILYLFPSSHITGLDRFLFYVENKKQHGS